MMKNIFLIILIALLNNTTFAQSTTVESLDERLTDLELKQSASKVNFGGDLKVLSSYYVTEDRNRNNTTAYGPKNLNAHALIFRINSNANISDQLKVYGQLESRSFLNQNFVTNNKEDTRRESNLRGDRVTLSKAYFDWDFWPKKMIFSAGRLATQAGPPEHLLDGVPREGTYPVSVYNVPLDGFALTANIHEFTGGNVSFISRTIANPSGGGNSDFTPWKSNSSGNPNKPMQVSDSNTFFTQMFEIEHKKKGVYENLLAILQFSEYKFGAVAPFETRQAVSAIGSEATPTLFYTKNDKSLKIQGVTLYSEVEKIAASRFDFYGSYSYVKVESLSPLMTRVLKCPVTAGDICDYSSSTEAQAGNFLYDGKQHGFRYFLGTRYELSNSLFLGGEYHRSSENAVPTNINGDSLMNFVNMSGKGQHFYLTKSLYGNRFSIRSGVTSFRLNHEIINGAIGVNSNEKVQSAYLNFAARF
jgi:hypothetical protein